ncbi:interleukin-6 [Pelobates fuscus]|uniref:interleukin-6 n=1 Tax=Pelobates fuscus TaxID=191477 RepID=UPI002FE4F640
MHSTSSSCKSVFYLVLICILSWEWVRSAPAPSIIVSSGEDVGTSTSNNRPTMHTSVELAKFIAQQANMLNKELCKTPNLCENSLETLIENPLKLPTMVSEDGCFQKGFNKEKCLRKIHHDLKKFQPYLLYVDKHFTSNQGNVELIRFKTMVLANNLKTVSQSVEETTTVSNTQQSTLTDGKSENLWTQKVTSHLILQAFTDYMENTSRAVRHSIKKGKRV